MEVVHVSCMRVCVQVCVCTGVCVPAKVCAEVFCPTTHCCSAVVCYNIKPRGRPENAHRCVSKGMQKGSGKGVEWKLWGYIAGAACDMSLRGCQIMNNIA